MSGDNEDCTSILMDSFGNPVPEAAFIVRATEISEFTDCRRKWWLHSQNGMHLESVRKSAPLQIGTIMHKAFEAVRLGEDPITKVQSAIEEIHAAMLEDPKLLDNMQDMEELESLGAMENLVIGMTEAFVEWNKNNPAAGTPVEVERRLLVPVIDSDGEPMAVAVGVEWRPLYLAARIDGMERDSNGNYWVCEDKTISKSTNLDHLPHIKLDVQAVLNIIAARQVWPDRVIIGSHYFFARKQLPSARVKNPIFRRTREIRNAAQVKFYTDHLLRVATAMFAVAVGEQPAYPSLPSTGGSQCEWKCDMTAVCEALNRDEDVGFLLDTLFVERKPFREVMREEIEDIKMKGSEE